MKKNEFAKLLISGFLKLLIFLALIFVLVGRLDYWQGWVFCGIALSSGIFIAIVFRNKTDLIQERMKPGPGMKWWDKVFWVFHIITFIVLLILAVLDGGRYGWTKEISVFWYVVSYAGHLISYAVVFWAMYINKFFSSVVRIQKDRGQTVIQNGPYAIVRHPGYVGVILMALTTGPVLGSVWALIPGGVWIILITIRTYLEDTTLQKELPGYKEYTKKVKYRLLPGIW